MSRLGRSQPVQPFATHGFLGNTPANGTLPGAVLVVEPDDRRRKTPPLQPVIISAALLSVTPPATTAPPAPLVVDRADQRVRSRPLDPVIISGARLVNSGVGAPGTTPPLPVNLDRDPQRIRRQPQEPVVVSGALANFPPATATPPVPYIVPVEERRRLLAAPNVTVGFDDVVPPDPTLVETDRRRLLPLDPYTSNPAGAATTPAPATPPAPFIVPVDERGRFVVVLPATGQHGFVDPGPAPVGTTPPPPTNIDRVDPRYGSKPIDPLVLSGVLTPPPPPAVVSGVDDITPVFATWM